MYLVSLAIDSSIHTRWSDFFIMLASDEKFSTSFFSFAICRRIKYYHFIDVCIAYGHLISGRMKFLIATEFQELLEHLPDIILEKLFF